MAESEKEIKSHLMKVKEENEKFRLKLNIQKTKMGIQSHYFMTNGWRNSGNRKTSYFWAPKSLKMVTAAMKLNDVYFLGDKL